MSFIADHQLSFMLVLIGICLGLTFAVLFAGISKIKKVTLFIIGISASMMLCADRLAYLYRGLSGSSAYYIVRICNFLLFFLLLVIIHTFNVYLADYCKNNKEIAHKSKRLKFSHILLSAGEILVVIFSFTGLYYSIDDSNIYHRGSLFWLSYMIPMFAYLIQLSVILSYRKKMTRLNFTGLVLFTIAPFAASFLQVFMYGVSLLNMTIVGLVVMLHAIEQINMRKRLNVAIMHEQAMINDEMDTMRAVMKETSFAFSEAIDAKDRYTHGHSTRVADYSSMIAKEFGYSESRIRNVYLTALLHDVGKIGVPAEIINKASKLTDEEYDQIKKHTVVGYQILSRIETLPSLCIGAHYHHERYDGKGYPDGLKGKEIPEIARIIAVADAYDAMSSKRSYRDALPQEKVRSEIEKGIGNQFDPEFAKIMLKFIDEDKSYDMREK